ncbi:MAG: helix-turn-helix transcriptional regulator [Clostridia bacterium]|nr:helix-turn-helix transcriptional regulator [Clostridia bacterium]
MEQFSTLNFEFLSVSYIITELFLLGVHLVVKENQRLKDLVRQKEKEVREANAKQVGNSEFSKDMIEDFRNGLSLLTPTERTIYEAYVAGASTKDILEKLSIKENTLKYHNKNIYGKLGVSSRKQLIAVAKATCL